MGFTFRPFFWRNQVPLARLAQETTFPPKSTLNDLLSTRIFWFLKLVGRVVTDLSLFFQDQHIPDYPLRSRSSLNFDRGLNLRLKSSIRSWFNSFFLLCTLNLKFIPIRSSKWLNNVSKADNKLWEQQKLLLLEKKVPSSLIKFCRLEYEDPRGLFVSTFFGHATSWWHE